jgi:subtilase family serine protease
MRRIRSVGARELVRLYMKGQLSVRRSVVKSVVLGVGFLLFTISLQGHRLLAEQAKGLVATEATGVGEALNPEATPSPQTILHLTLALSSVRQRDSDQYVEALYNRKSPLYHKWLTPEQYGEKFGASSTDVGTVVKYLVSEGMTNIKVWPNQLFVSAQTTRLQAESVFGVHILGYSRTPQEVALGYSPTYFAPDHEPVIDSETAKCLTGLFGLSNAAERKPFSTHRLEDKPDITNNPLNPADLSKLYNVSSLHSAGMVGAGQTIAIFSPSAFQQSDINAFFAANNITDTNVKIINVNGGNTDLTNQGEACLDIETAAGQAPGATIAVYEGPNDGSFDIFDQMASDDPNIVSESYGADENSVTATYAASYETLREQMAAEGISIFVSSGDDGAFDGNNQTTVTTSVDATSAYVTAVGGTELLPYTNDNWNGEVGWTYDDGTFSGNAGSGGGLSKYYREPSWETGMGVANSYSNGFRQIPDVSAVASTPFYNIYTQGAFGAYGGTSCSAAFWAGAMALVEESVGGRLGNIDPSLYSFASSDPGVYHDIVSGNDGLYDCTPGWDFVTGWGSANFAELLDAFKGISTGAPTGSSHTFGPGLQMFCLPYSYSDSATPASLLSGLVTSSGTTTGDIAAWLPADQSYAVTPTAPANVPVPGQGYWGRFNSTSGGTLIASGTAVTTPTYSVTLSPGWNMIGDPFVNSVSVDSLEISSGATTVSFADAISEGEIAPSIYDYNGAAYVRHGVGDDITPYDGYWINSFVSGTLVFISP